MSLILGLKTNKIEYTSRNEVGGGVLVIGEPRPRYGRRG